MDTTSQTPRPRLPVVDQIFGHNKAPLAEVLAADYADLEREVADLIAKAAAGPAKIEDDEANIAAGRVIAEIRDMAKRVEAARVDVGRPILEAQRGVNGHFAAITDRLTEAEAPLRRRADDYVRARAAAERARAEREAQEARARAEVERQRAEAAKTAAGAARADARAETLEATADRAEAASTAAAKDLVRNRAAGLTASARTEWAFSIVDYGALVATLGPLGHFIDRAAVEKAVRSLVRIQKGGASLPGVSVYEDVKSTFRR